MELSDAPEKNPQWPGIDPGTLQLVAQCLNHYTTPGPSKEMGLEANADKTKHMVMSWDQVAGRGHRVKNDNSSFERMEELKYLGTTLTN
jgi:hypothetical protein